MGGGGWGGRVGVGGGGGFAGAGEGGEEVAVREGVGGEDGVEEGDPVGLGVVE